MALSKILPASQSQFAGARNMIINGAMIVSQRGTSFTGLANNAYSLDRFVYYEIGNSVSDVSQSTDTPNNNFNNSLKLDVTTADASVAAGDLTCFLQKIEGLNSYKLGWGTSDAKSVTLSFYVKSTKTGVHSGAFKNSAQDRSYAFEYTVNSSNTWEFKTVTVAGDTSGTWLTTNGIGVQVTFALMAGTDFTKAAGSWGSGNNFGSDNQVNVMDSTSNEWYITGIQLEIGETATPFEHEDIGTTLAKCQRYYEECRLYALAYHYLGTTNSSDHTGACVNYSSTKRATPTIAHLTGSPMTGLTFTNGDHNGTGFYKVASFGSGASAFISATSEL